ncbi:hypothetical protein D9611_012405 [Ephemerocybe angulata]|uniref:Oxidation resistance protein 1 n=1 Tax=Ephemerocybe angulata TaxID=980116 RepID=A0A8H5CE26_9AGAR|nr:hypothetical protein D9611_012405 [Tulosesus angulatus]
MDPLSAPPNSAQDLEQDATVQPTVTPEDEMLRQPAAETLPLLDSEALISPEPSSSSTPPTSTSLNRPTSTASDDFGDFVDAPPSTAPHGPQLPSLNPLTPANPLSLAETPLTPSTPLSAAPPPPPKPTGNHIADILQYESGGLSLFSDPVFRERKDEEGLPSPPPIPPPKSPFVSRSGIGLGLGGSASTSRAATPTPGHGGYGNTIDYHARPPLTPPNTALLHPLASTPSPLPGRSPRDVTTPLPPLPPPLSANRPSETTTRALMAAPTAKDETEIIAQHLGLIDHDYFTGREPAETAPLPIPIIRTRSKSWGLRGASAEGRPESPAQTRTMPTHIAPPVVSSGGEWEGEDTTGSYGGTLGGLWGLWKGASGSTPGSLSSSGSEEHPHASHPHVAGIFTASPPPTIIEGSATTSSPPPESQGEYFEHRHAHEQGVHGHTARPLPRARTSLETVQARWNDSHTLTPPTHSRGSGSRTPSPNSSRRQSQIEDAKITHESPFAAPLGTGGIVRSSKLSVGFGSDKASPVVGKGSLNANPFATHNFAPIAGAPGFRPDGYDWDKGFSDQLERDLDGGRGPVSSASTARKSAPHSSSGGRDKELQRGRQGGAKKAKEAIVPLYQTLGSKLGFGWGSSSSPSSSATSASSSPAAAQRNTVPAPQSRIHSEFLTNMTGNGHERSATSPVVQREGTRSAKKVGELIERMVGGVELKGRKESTVGILTGGISELLRPYLPPLSRLPRTWTLLYSLDQHGISLNTLYTNCEAPEKNRKTAQPFIGMNGAIVIIRDAEAEDSAKEEKSAFGAFIAEGMGRKAKGFYGGGDSFLWKYTAQPEALQVFKPTGRNSYFAICDAEYIGFGGGGTSYALWIDNTLLQGSSAPSVTFGNEVLCSGAPTGKGGSGGSELAKEVEFECVGLEVWGVGPT